MILKKLSKWFAIAGSLSVMLVFALGMSFISILGYGMYSMAKGSNARAESVRYLNSRNAGSYHRNVYRVEGTWNESLVIESIDGFSDEVVGNVINNKDFYELGLKRGFERFVFIDTISKKTWVAKRNGVKYVVSNRQAP